MCRDNFMVGKRLSNLGFGIKLIIFRHITVPNVHGVQDPTLSFNTELTSAAEAQVCPTIFTM